MRKDAFWRMVSDVAGLCCFVIYGGNIMSGRIWENKATHLAVIRKQREKKEVEGQGQSIPLKSDS